MARIIAGVTSSHVPAIGAAIDNHRTASRTGSACSRASSAPRNGSPRPSPMSCIVRLQRSRLGVLGRDDPDLRARHRGRIPASPTKAGARARCRWCKGHPELAAHIAQSVILDEFDLTLVQQDGGRPRPHRAAQPDVRHAEGMAVPGDPARGQRGAVPAADRQPLLQSRQGDPQGGRVLSGRPEGRDLRHRRHVAPDQRPARRPDQQQVRPRLPRQPHQESEEAHALSHLE